MKRQREISDSDKLEYLKKLYVITEKKIKLTEISKLEERLRERERELEKKIEEIQNLKNDKESLESKYKIQNKKISMQEDQIQKLKNDKESLESELKNFKERSEIQFRRLQESFVQFAHEMKKKYSKTSIFN